MARNILILLCLFALTSFCTGQRVPADKPVPRSDSNSMKAHEQLLEKKKAGRKGGKASST